MPCSVSIQEQRCRGSLGAGGNSEIAAEHVSALIPADKDNILKFQSNVQSP